jgi:hypothetical protein
MRPHLFRWMLPFLLLPITTCSDSSRSNPTSPRALVGPLCQLGCTETDPNPNAPGVFLGSGVTPDVCYFGTYTDADQDGLGDFCEKNLAAAFAPELYYYNGDNVGREPHWVARISSGDKVMVGYLLSYYRDEGSQAYLCTLPPPFHDPSCEGHNGDSEAIFEETYYDFTSQHWVLNQASYSQHTSYGVYTRGTKAYPFALIYPAHAGAYPRAYVAQGKHANYASRNECNSGGAFGTDICESVNTTARVAAGASLNLGSRSNHSASQDCMPSSNPSYEYYGSGRLECYWTQVRFRGWIPINVGGADSDPYSPRLQGMGF